ncbi:hypothetical protein OEM_32660 [Mycobacterium intracellulare subsp. yongonense 05-1390]|nr:hypothetical protein OEM_32660 [Mycobacterium intracellulare subsp. yongonense 05-1390]
MLDMPAGMWLAPMLGELVRILRRFGALDIDGDTGGAAMTAPYRRPSIAVWRPKARSTN